MAEHSDGFAWDMLVCGGVEHCGIGIVGHGAGKDDSGAGAGMGDVDERNLDGLQGAVVIEIEARELADAELVVDVHASVNFLAAVAVGFEAVAGFEKLDLSRVLWFLSRS